VLGGVLVVLAVAFAGTSDFGASYGWLGASALANEVSFAGASPVIPLAVLVPDCSAVFVS
jgi:hypothetical protein